MCVKLAAACSSAKGVPSGVSSSGCERGLSGLLANYSLTVSSLPKWTRKNSPREGLAISRL